MSGLVNALVIVAVVVLVVARQFRARPIGTDRRWWVVPAVLAIVAVRGPGILDSHRPVVSALLLSAELLIGLAIGAGWAWTTRVWKEPDGVVWTRSTKSSALVWVSGIVMRVGLFALGGVLGVHQDSSAVLLGLAGTLALRSGVLIWRAKSLTGPVGPAPAYGAATDRSSWKELV